MNITWFTTILILALLILGPGILGLGIKKIPSGYQPPLSDSQQVLPMETVSQSFAAGQNGLSGVALTVRNPFKIKNGLLNMSLSQNGTELSKVTIAGANIIDGDFVNFSFPPIPDSKGQIYTATFSSDEVTTQFPFAIYHSNQSDEGIYQVNGEKREGGLSFITYYAPENIFQNLIIIYRNWFWKFFQDLEFAVFYCLVILVSVGYLSRELLISFRGLKSRGFL